MRAEIIGVRLLGPLGSGPVDLVEVQLGPGLTAFAGLNGAGKSKILSGVTAALAGTTWADGRWELFFRMTDGDSMHGRLESIWSVWFSLLQGRQDRLDFANLTGAEISEALLAMDDVSAAWRSALAAYLRLAVSRIPVTNSEQDDLAKALTAGSAFAFCSTDDGVELRMALDRGVEEPSVSRWVTRLDAAVQYELSLYEPRHAPSDGQLNSPEARPLGSFGPQDPIFYVPDDKQPTVGALLPIPLFTAVRFGPWQGWPIDVVDLATPADVDALTNELLSKTLKSGEDVLDVIAEQQSAPPAGATAPQDAENAPARKNIADIADAIGAEATRLYFDLVGDSLTLRCEIHPAETWLDKGYGFSWVATPHPQRISVGIEDLSDAQQRWARFAMVVAIGRVSGARVGRGTWVIADEPEAGVHRTAETRLADQMRKLSVDVGVSGVIVATHSSKVIGSAHTRFLVRRGRGAGHLTRMPEDISRISDDLGLEITDLLGWYQQILFVEGAHDEAVLGALLQGELDRTRTLVIPLRGIKRTGNVVDATFLDFTTARVVVLVDGLGAEAETAWNKLGRLIAAGDMRAARATAKSAFAGEAYEQRFLREVANRTLSNGQLSRYTVLALSVPDIIDLLPVSQVLSSRAKSWPELRREHKGSSRRHDDFKTWAAELYGEQPIGAKRLAKIASGLQTLPPDIQRVADVLTARDSPDA